MDEPELLEALLASLDPDDCGAALRVLQREALREATDILNGGKVFPKEQPHKNGRRPFDQCPI